MELLEHTAQIRAYCDYLDEHALNVERAWKELQERCGDLRFTYDDYVYHSIDAMVTDHDLSKVSPEEFIQYQRNFFQVGEKDKGGFASAWQHHQDENPHHWQHWATREYRNPYEPECRCVCMVLDWMAMAYKFENSAEAYYLEHGNEMALPAWAVAFISEIFDRIREPRSGDGGEGV